MHITGQTDTLEFWILIGFYPFLLKTSFGIFLSDLERIQIWARFSLFVYISKGESEGDQKYVLLGKEIVGTAWTLLHSPIGIIFLVLHAFILLKIIYRLLKSKIYTTTLIL